MDERVIPYNVFQTLRLENVGGRFSTGNFFIDPTIMRK